MSNMRFRKAFLSIVVASSFAFPANAAVVTANLTVKLTISSSCTITTPADLDFGNTSSIATDVPQTSTFTVTCSLTTPFWVGLGSGQNSASVTARKMKRTAGTELVDYSLTTDPSHVTNWGDTQATGVSGVGTAAPEIMTIYGIVPGQTTPVPGNYTDVVTVTLTY